MRKVLVVIGLVAGVILATDEARGEPLPECEIQTCDNGTVFCRSIFDGKEAEAGSAGGFEVSCELKVADAPCSEVAECKLRVPAVGTTGLSVLGIAMALAGVFFARRHRSFSA